MVEVAFLTLVIVRQTGIQQKKTMNEFKSHMCSLSPLSYYIENSLI